MQLKGSLFSQFSLYDAFFSIVTGQQTIRAENMRQLSKLEKPEGSRLSRGTLGFTSAAVSQSPATDSLIVDS